MLSSHMSVGLCVTFISLGAASLSLKGAEPAASAPAVPDLPSLPRASRPDPKQVSAAVHDLNHPSPSRRRQAVRQLAAWGPLAFDELNRAADGPAFESALLARDLLRELGNVFFVGAEVRLEVDRHEFAWDEPITLTVHVLNRSAGPVLVPWSPPADPPAVRQDDPAQVGAMLDIADYLRVTGPDGEPVGFRTDPIERGTAVSEEVELRAGDQPPVHAISPGGGETLVVTRFNRGWARYPLLEGGKYAVQFVYQPAWEDAAWVEQGFGRVASSQVELAVSQAAPESIRASRTPMRLTLVREHDGLVGTLQSCWDRDLWVNLNFGGPIETHARLEWSPQPHDRPVIEPFQLPADATGAMFQSGLLRQLGPGESFMLTRRSVAELRRQLGALGEQDPDAALLSLRYINLAGAESLRQALRGAARGQAVPTQLFNGSLSSDALPLTTSTAPNEPLR